MEAASIENKGVTRWNPKKKLEDVAAALALLQVSSARSLDIEREIAKVAGEYLHSHDNQDFMLCAELKVERMFKTRHYPRSLLESREDLRAFVYRQTGLNSIEEAAKVSPSSDTCVDSYFHGFELGSELGYPKELEEYWYIVLADARGYYYVPVDAVVAVVHTSF